MAKQDQEEGDSNREGAKILESVRNPKKIEKKQEIEKSQSMKETDTGKFFVKLSPDPDPVQVQVYSWFNQVIVSHSNLFHFKI